MSETIEVKVPDIGDFKDIPVIEVLVKPGDAVEKETPLITLESDKATMEVPSPAAGTVREVAVKVGDKVSEGTLVVRLDAKEGQARAAPPPEKRGDGADKRAATPGKPAAPEQPVAASRGGTAPVEQ